MPERRNKIQTRFSSLSSDLLIVPVLSKTFYYFSVFCVVCSSVFSCRFFLSEFSFSFPSSCHLKVSFIVVSHVMFHVGNVRIVVCLSTSNFFVKCDTILLTKITKRKSFSKWKVFVSEKLLRLLWKLKLKLTEEIRNYGQVLHDLITQWILISFSYTLITRPIQHHHRLRFVNFPKFCSYSFFSIPYFSGAHMKMLQYEINFSQFSMYSVVHIQKSRELKRRKKNL